MNIKKYIKFFPQISIKEAIMVLAYLIVEKINKKPSKKWSLYYELIYVFTFINEKGYTSSKRGNSNLLCIEDKEIGDYRINLRRKSSDFGVFIQCLLEKQYQTLVNISKKINHPVRTIIDAGANIGCTTLFFRKCFPDSTIISLEPEKNNFAQLSQNIALNHFQNIHILNKGLWSTDDETLMINNDYGDKRDWAFNLKLSTQTEKGTLQSISISKILKDYSIKELDILKIDIEGSEKYIFEDESNFSEWLPKCKMIAIEFHDDATEEKTKGYLKKYNFEISREGELIIAVRKY